MDKSKQKGHQRRASIGKSLPISTLILANKPKCPRSLERQGSDKVIPEIFTSSPAVEQFDDEEQIKEMQQRFDMNDFRAKFQMAEALSQASMLTSPAAKRRLAARKIEMDSNTCFTMDNNLIPIPNEEDDFYIPPKELLMYLVRMGSFNSTPKINNVDSQDDGIEIPEGLSIPDFIHHCKMMRGENRPQLLTRYFLKPLSPGQALSSDITDGLRILNLDTVSKTCGPAANRSPKHIRLLQWNILSQSLGAHNDGFVSCPDEALTWECRKFQILQEIIQNDPDVMCLQEVDHFKFLQNMLKPQGYEGVFFPKPDSPCLYITENNGPDGCAIFYKKTKFELVNCVTRILEVWRVQSNQVAVAAILRIPETGFEFCLGTTHLKARKGALLSKLRNEQGKDLMRFIRDVAEQRPILLSGDFNAEPIEPVYSTILNTKGLQLSSAYADILAKQNGSPEAQALSKSTEEEAVAEEQDPSAEETQHDCAPVGEEKAQISASQEPQYTTWKIREEGEVCHTIDYVFYSQDKIKVNNCLMFPQDHEIGKNRVPSFQYPSDHFSLVCDFEIRDN